MHDQTSKLWNINIQIFFKQYDYTQYYSCIESKCLPLSGPHFFYSPSLGGNTTHKYWKVVCFDESCYVTLFDQKSLRAHQGFLHMCLLHIISANLALSLLLTKGACVSWLARCNTRACREKKKRSRHNYTDRFSPVALCCALHSACLIIFWKQVWKVFLLGRRSFFSGLFLQLVSKLQWSCSNEHISRLH